MVSYDWHVRIQRAAPDCFSKEVIVVNGEFQPSITVRQGNILQVRTRMSELFKLSLTNNVMGRGTISMQSAYHLGCVIYVMIPRESNRVKLNATPTCGARRCIMG